MERFESSDAISASECGHVFHGACIARWLDTSSSARVSSQCPQCRSTVSRDHLVRLYFAADRTPTSTAAEDELRAQLELANKLLVSQQALYEHKLRAKERETHERSNAIVAQLERVCTSQRSQLEQAQRQIEHWKHKSERLGQALSPSQYAQHYDPPGVVRLPLSHPMFTYRQRFIDVSNPNSLYQ